MCQLVYCTLYFTFYQIPTQCVAPCKSGFEVVETILFLNPNIIQFCFYFSRNYFALICQMGTLKEFMDHYDKLVPNIYVPEPGIMEVLLCCNVGILSFKLTYIKYYIEMFYLSIDLNPLLLILDIPFLAHVWLYLVVSSFL